MGHLISRGVGGVLAVVLVVVFASSTVAGQASSAGCERHAGSRADVHSTSDTRRPA